MNKAKKSVEAPADTIEEATNVDTTSLEGMSKTNAMSVIMKQMADMDKDTWVEFFNNVQASIGKEADLVPADAAAKNLASVSMKESINEDLSALFGDSKELSEDFKSKASVLFESAVNSRVALIEAKLEEAFETALAEEVDTIRENISEQVEKYLTAIAEKWQIDNEVAIKKNLRAEIAENFITALGELYREFNYDIPEDKIEIAEALAEEVDSLEERLNASLLENIALQEDVSILLKDKIISDLSENLTVIEADKFTKLVEGFDIESDVDSYISKLETIKQHHFGKKTPVKASTGIVTEEISYGSEKEIKESTDVSPQMASYVAAYNHTKRSY